MNLTFVLKEDYLKLLWFMFFDQSLMFRIQQLKQLLEDSTSDDEDGSSSSSSECKEKHKKRKKKEKHKKRKKEKKKKKKRKHKSSKSNESSDSDWQAFDHAAFSSLRSNTGQSTEARGIREDEEGVTPRRRPSGVTRDSPTFQWRRDHRSGSCIVPGANSRVADFRPESSFSSSSLLSTVVSDSSAVSGRPD